MKNSERTFSFIIPVYNEEQTVSKLYEGIEKEMAKNGLQNFEIIFIDDGSDDSSWSCLEELGHRYPKRVKLIKLRKNFGKSQALATGFHYSTGEIVFTMDADLQDDPTEIPRFIKKIDEGYDLVSGWKQKRYDPISKTLPSKFFNFITRIVSGVKLHDFNCGFKVYRSEVLRSITLYGELHRYVPVIAYNQGFKVGEISVSHHPRKYGKSKYGFERYMQGFLDLLTVVATTKYLQKPAHLFGGVGIVFGIIGFVTLGYLTFLKILGHLIGGRPLLFFGVMMAIMSIQFISLGLIAELIVCNDKTFNIMKQVSKKVNI